MAIRTLAEAPNIGPVTRLFVEVTNDRAIRSSDEVKATGWEVSCEALGCERYACTNLTEEEAIEEQREHARTVHDITA